MKKTYAMPPKKVRTPKKKKRIRLECSLMSLIAGCVGLFFLLAWIFVLGILVGRGFLPDSVRHLSHLKAPLSKIQDMVGTKRPSDLEEIKKRQ